LLLALILYYLKVYIFSFAPYYLVAKGQMIIYYHHSPPINKKLILFPITPIFIYPTWPYSYKYLKKNRNISKIVWYIEIVNTNILWLCHGSMVFFYSYIKKQLRFFFKLVLRNNLSFSLIFYLFFLKLLQTKGNYLLLSPKVPTRFTFLPESIFTVLNGANT